MYRYYKISRLMVFNFLNQYQRLGQNHRKKYEFYFKDFLISLSSMKMNCYLYVIKLPWVSCTIATTVWANMRNFHNSLRESFE